jgi:hypothetical protein
VTTPDGPLDEDSVLALADKLEGDQNNDRVQMDTLRRYFTGKQQLPQVIPQDAPREVREMSRISRINMIKIVVEALVESLYVDNIRSVDDPKSDATGDADDVVSNIWAAWQANRLDGRQGGLYRAVFQYGCGYMVVTDGDPYPVIRPVSPRKLTAWYEDDPDWPVYALERRHRPGERRLYDDRFVYTVGRDLKAPTDAGKGAWSLLAVAEHGSANCPVVRYVDSVDLDEDDEPISMIPEGVFNQTLITAGQVAPLIALQDQTDVTSFGLLSAQWYTAFRQRWIVGWTPANKQAKMAAAASQIWTFEDSPDDVRLGEFSETTLDGYLRSRDASLRYGATLSQTPVHELTGELVNLAAEALAAAEAGRDRKVDLRKTGMGESHEQMAQLVGDLMSIDVPDDIEIVWRDTSARAFAAVVDALGKLAQMLQIPAEELWDRIPGVTRQDVQRWKAAAENGDSLGNLTKMLGAQVQPGAPVPAPPNPDGTTTTPGGLILPPGARTV